MSEQDKKVHLLFIIKNGETENAKPWEAGSKSRLSTLQTGIIQGLIVAGYRRYATGRSGIILMTKESEIISVCVIPHDNWIQE